MATINCFPPFRHKIPCALCLALDSTGNNNAARIAMMAMTTSSSMSVKARRGFMRIKTTLIQICFKVFSPASIHVRRCPKPDKLFGIIFRGVRLCPAQRDQPQQRGNDRCREITRRVWQEQRAAAGLTTQPRSWKKRRRAAALQDAGAIYDDAKNRAKRLGLRQPSGALPLELSRVGHETISLFQ